MIAEIIRGFLHALVYVALTSIGLGLSLLGGAWLAAPGDLFA